MPGTAPIRLAARDTMSSAARRVNVSSRIRSAGTPRSKSQATREVSVLVLPVPAPAMTTRGPSPWVTAVIWASSSPASHPAV